MMTIPGVAIAILASVLSWFGVAIVSPKGADGAATRRGYLTITAALAAGSTFVVVLPGTYAENIAPASGVRVILLGATVGTGAGVAATAPAGGSATIGGWGSLSATAAISAAAGSYLVLGEGVDISGTVSGVYRVGRRWVLQSGEAIATYCPADGSVVPVTVGDHLWDGEDWFVAIDCDGTTRWGQKVQIYSANWNPQNSGTANGYAYHYWTACAPSSNVANVWYESARFFGKTSAGDGVGVDWNNLQVNINEVQELLDTGNQAIAGGTRFDRTSTIQVLRAIAGAISYNVRLDLDVGGGAPAAQYYNAALLAYYIAS